MKFLLILGFSFFLLYGNETEWELEQKELDKARKEELRKHDPSWIYTESYEAGYSAGVQTKEFIKNFLKDDKEK